MNTLSRAMTARIFPNIETYYALRTHWSRLVNSDRKHGLSAAHHLLYLAFLGKDWRKAFSPVTNSRKLANGGFFGWKLLKAIPSLHYQSCQDELLAPFDGLVSPEMLAKIRELIPAHIAYSWTPAQFLSGAFPSDAYADEALNGTASALPGGDHAG